MPNLFLDLFHYVCIWWLGMTLHDLTILYGNAHVTKLWWANTQGRIFLLLVVCCVKVGMSVSIEESLVANVWMHKDSTGQMMNQVITPFQQRFGMPCLLRATLSVWEKACLYRGIWSILLETSIPDFNLYCGCRLHWTITTQVCGETISGTCSTTFDDVWQQEGPGDEVILASVCNWTQQYWHETMSKACALLLEWFLVALSHGKVLHSDECAFYCSFLSWNVFWG